MRISAVMGTRDEAELLVPSVAALLAAGVDSVDILDDASTDATAQVIAGLRATDPRVHATPPLPALGADMAALLALDGPVLAPLIQRETPDWLLVCDSDEVLMTAPGGLRAAIAAASSPASPPPDALEITRYNAVPGPDGIDVATLAAPEVLRRLPLMVARTALDPARLPPATEMRWISHRLAPKLLVRVAAAARYHNGVHQIRPHPGHTLHQRPTDRALMVHLPFTDLPRFRRKVANIARFLDRFDGLSPDWGWHWRHWLTLHRAGRLDEEFARQCLTPEAAAPLWASGALSTAAALLDRAPPPPDPAVPPHSPPP